MSSSVFVAGAGGYIGEGVALAFRRAGYKVYGLIRNQNKVPALLKNEIIPVVVTSMEDVDSYKHILVQCSVIVDAVGLGDFSEGFLKAANEAGRQRNIANDSELGIYKPLFIFTSGIMTYGDASNGPLDETIKPKPTHQWTENRRRFENQVLKSSLGDQPWIRTVVVRPGFVFGRSGGPIATQFFNIPKDSDLVLYGSPHKRWSWVHVDDLGDGYVLIARSGPSVVDGQIFNLAVTDNPTYLDLRVTMAKAVGWNEEKFKIEYRDIPRDDVGVLVWENTVIINPAKALDLLGWKPRHVSFLGEIETYYQSWLASQSSN